MIRSQVRAWSRTLLALFRSRLYLPKQRPVRDDRFCPTDPATAVLVEEVGRRTALISNQTVVPGPYSPHEAAKGQLAFPIETYSEVFRELAISQAVVGILCVIDQNGERAIRGLQPDGKLTMVLLTKPRVLSPTLFA
jgi:hypothetical protein